MCCCLICGGVVECVLLDVWLMFVFGGYFGCVGVCVYCCCVGVELLGVCVVD